MATHPDTYSQVDVSYQSVNETAQSDYLKKHIPLGPGDEMQVYRDKISYYLMGIGGSIVCCLGTVANVLSVAVLTRRSMRSSTYTYLTALAVCDTLVLFLTLLILIKDVDSPDIPEQTAHFHAILFPFVHPAVIVFQVTSIWLTLAFTVDRYIMICHPFRAETMCRRSRARKVIVCLYASGLIFNIPRFLEYTTILHNLPFENGSQVITFYGVEQTPLGSSVLFREIIHSWMYLLFICGIPFLTLVILNAFLIRAVHLSRLKGKEINSREKHRNDTTIMLIGVIVIFLICQGPALVSRMIYAFQQHVFETNTTIFTLNEVGNFFVLLNSAINIVPYYLFGRKFRSEFWRIFCSCFFDKDELRRFARSYSLSIDQRRMSQYNVIEMNGVAHSNHGCRNSVVYGDHAGKSHRNNRTYNDQMMHGLTTNGTSTTLLHNETCSVVVPLIHETFHSICSNLLPKRNTSQDSLRNITSNLCSVAEPPSLQSSHLNPSGRVRYMAVAAGPCIGGPECSAV